MRQEPVRSCTGCGARRPKRELLRFTVKDGDVVADPHCRLGGRGWYICPDGDCLTKLERKGRIAKAGRLDREVLARFVKEIRSEVAR